MTQSTRFSLEIGQEKGEPIRFCLSTAWQKLHLLGPRAHCRNSNTKTEQFATANVLVARHCRMFRDIAGHEDLTEAIIGCAIRVHEHWGPGLLESVYKACLIVGLEADGHRVNPNLRVPLIYKGHDLKAEFCPDLIIDDVIVGELKVVEKLAPVHKAQVVTYLKLTDLPVGLLMNFNVPLLKQGIHRIVRPDLLIKANSLRSPFSLLLSFL
jgi:GxxExxY protein